MSTLAQKVCAVTVGVALGFTVGSLVDSASSVQWPAHPTKAQIVQRIGRPAWNRLTAIAQCETGGNPRHYPNGSYIGYLGMARSTYGIGQAVTHYRWPAEGATIPEQVAVGYVVAMRFGYSAWGCG